MITDITYKDMAIGVYGSFNNWTAAEINASDGCGRSELLQQCNDKLMFVYGFQVPVAEHLTDYTINVTYRQVFLSIHRQNASSSVLYNIV